MYPLDTAMMHRIYVCNSLLLLYLFFNYIETDEGIPACPVLAQKLVKLSKWIGCSILDYVVFILSLYFLTLMKYFISFNGVQKLLFWLFLEFCNQFVGN